MMVQMEEKLFGVDNTASQPVEPITRQTHTIFDGQHCFDWLMRVEKFFIIERYSEDEMLEWVVLSSSGFFRRWFSWEQFQRSFLGWTDFKERLLMRFGESCESIKVDEREGKVLIQEEISESNTMEPTYSLREEESILENKDMIPEFHTKDFAHHKSIRDMKLIKDKTSSEATNSLFESDFVHPHTSLLQSQVPLSSLESSLTFCSDSMDAYVGLSFSFVTNKELQPRSPIATISKKEDASQLFDKMLLRVRRKKQLSMQRKLPKSWKFKYKTKIIWQDKTEMKQKTLIQKRRNKREDIKALSWLLLFEKLLRNEKWLGVVYIFCFMGSHRISVLARALASSTVGETRISVSFEHTNGETFNLGLLPIDVVGVVNPQVWLTLSETSKTISQVHYGILYYAIGGSLNFLVCRKSIINGSFVKHKWRYKKLKLVSALLFVVDPFDNMNYSTGYIMNNTTPMWSSKRQYLSSRLLQNKEKFFFCCFCTTKDKAFTTQAADSWIYTIGSLFVLEPFCEGLQGQNKICGNEVMNTKWKDLCYSCNVQISGIVVGLYKEQVQSVPRVIPRKTVQQLWQLLLVLLFGVLTMKVVNHTSGQFVTSDYHGLIARKEIGLITQVYGGCTILADPKPMYAFMEVGQVVRSGGDDKVYVTFLIGNQATNQEKPCTENRTAIENKLRSVKKVESPKTDFICSCADVDVAELPRLPSGTVSAYRVNALAPEICDQSTRNAKDPHERADLVLNNIEIMNCNKYLTTEEIVDRSPTLNLALVAHIFHKWNGQHIDGTYSCAGVMTEDLQNCRDERCYQLCINSFGNGSYANHVFDDVRNRLIPYGSSDLKTRHSPAFEVVSSFESALDIKPNAHQKQKKRKSCKTWMFKFKIKPLQQNSAMFIWYGSGEVFFAVWHRWRAKILQQFSTKIFFAFKLEGKLVFKGEGIDKYPHVYTRKKKRNKQKNELEAEVDKGKKSL